MLIKNSVVSVGNFYLKCLLTEFVMPNLSQIYFCIPEMFKLNILKPVFEYKIPFAFLLSCCDFTNVICSQKAGVKYIY